MELDWLYDDDYSAPAYAPTQGYSAPYFPTYDMNPANGLPMLPGGGFDVAGNAFGLADFG